MDKDIFEKLHQFYNGKTVFITGHNGFKGTWMCHVLSELGANIVGYSLAEPDGPSLFRLSNTDKFVKSYIGDIRDLNNLKIVFDKSSPEIVIHMAAQPIVRASYENPVYTYETNVLGTVNILECIRLSDSVKSFVNVTTDKVYYNKEYEWGYREIDELNGYDPYSNSKSCSELVTSSYKKSFFQVFDSPAITTCRAGNVIGGGDFAANRVIPDCVRSVLNGTMMTIRNPKSIRPYQHVLEPVIVYLIIAMEQYNNKEIEGNYNIGPLDSDCSTTKDLVEMFFNEWNKKNNSKLTWTIHNDGGPHEANYLKLDCSRIRNKIGWKPVWNIRMAISKCVDWTIVYVNNQDINAEMSKEISEYFHALVNN
jgi:CDP-glucose 4,6-dehydratase